MATNPLKDVNDRGIVKGLAEFGTVARQDVDELLFNEPECFNLFLIALKQLQDSKGDRTDEFTKWDDKMGWFQIAGIHGLPNAPWDGEKGRKNVDGSTNQSGYCAHGTQTFPTWHRPYLAMLEQAIYKKMIDVAEKYDEPKKSVYKAAVKKFRLPYWDYLRPRDYNAEFPGVRLREGLTLFPYDFRAPLIFTVPKVTVKMYPKNTPVSIDNPLSTFKFPDPSTGFFTPKDWKATFFSDNAQERLQTMRENDRLVQDRNRNWVDIWGVNNLSDLDSLNAVLNIVREGTVRMSLNFVEKGIYQNYIDFATAGVLGGDPTRDPNRPSGSLEALHGAYHNYIGGGGHMSMVTTAAFDPIFWLHHCQIDRYFAIWQGSNPKDSKPVNSNPWFASAAEAGRKLGLNDKDAAVTADSDLLPFRRPGGKYWTSNLAANTEDLGYTYADIKDLSPSAVRDRYKQRYAWARRLTIDNSGAESVTAKPPADLEPLSLDDSPFFQKANGQGFVDGYKPLKIAKPISLPISKVRHVLAASEVPALEESVFSLAASAQPEAFAIKTEAVPDVQPTVSSAPEAQIPEEKVSREWYIDDQIQRLALNGSFSILWLVGEFDQNLPLPLLRLSPAFVGNTHIFTAPVEACDNCGHQAEQAHLVTNTTPITDQLLDYVATGRLQSMRPEHVKPFLVANLKWRVVEPSGEKVEPRELTQSKDFKISVSCKIAPLPGQQGDVVYEQYDDISDEIIANAS